MSKELREAAGAGDLGGVKAALAGGADVNARGEYGSSALNEAAAQGHAEVVEALVAAGADIENKGGADLTPLMNAVLGGHTNAARVLLDRGARVTDDLLSSVKMKVNILKENAESGQVLPEAVEAWEGVFSYLAGARLKQDLPEIVKALPDAGAVKALASAARRGFNISSAIAALEELTRAEDADTRYDAGEALAAYSAHHNEWDRVSRLLAEGDGDVKAGVVTNVVAAAKGGFDVAPVIPALVKLLGDAAVNLRHDGAVAIGYAATNGADASAALPALAKLFGDERFEVRKISAWAIYRIAQHGTDVASILPALKKLLEDENDDVRGMAEEAVAMAESK